MNKRKLIEEYTIGELADLLPESLSNDIGTYYLVLTKKNGKWSCMYEGMYEGIKPNKYIIKVLQDMTRYLVASEFIKLK